MVTPPPLMANAEAALRQVARDEAGRIAEDVACRNCGYNLRGLTLDGICPECQVPVGRSVQGDLLRLCEPRWVERLAQGALLVILGIFGGIALMILAGVVGAILGARGVASGELIAAIMAGVSLTVALVMVLGFWLITQPDPGAVETQPINARTLARYCLLGTLVASPLQGLMDPSGAMKNPAGAVSLGGAFIFLGIMSVLSLIAQAIGYVALFEYARQLALRLPHPSLANQARLVKWGYLVMQTIGVLTGIAMLIALPPFLASMAGAGGAATAPASGGISSSPLAFFGPAMIVAVGLACLAAPISLVFQIWAIVLLFRFRSQFKLAAEAAKATWARAA